MFMGVVATGDKAWARSSGTLPSECFKDVDSDMLEENEEENVVNDVHISNDAHIDGNNKKKILEAGTLHFKIGRKKSSKQIEAAASLSNQIEKLCNAADNMSQTTCSLTPVMDLYGISQAVKVLDSLSKEVSKDSPLYFFPLKLLVDKDKQTMFLSINSNIGAWWIKMEMEESSKFSSLLGS
ncbi:hypothetical protein Godav_023124 [Gossypium davidsonii]|uniref:Uncharacterized protein n=1 Tax=Gossypium davidsonii TaxID=34287 RepID=A0A7J8SRD0_GOSDV|nr:hypothetical protein [Gossypium davidsonii]